MKHSINYLKQNSNFNKPVLLFFHMNSMIYQQFKTRPFNLILNKFKQQNIKNLILAPILTDSMSNLNHRIEQVKNHIDKAVLNNNNSKLHILCYSMANLPIHGYIHKYNSNIIDSVLFLSSPNQ